VLLNSVNGPLGSQDLGKTLMHEHLVGGFAGWQADSRTPAPDRRRIIDVCVDRIEELKSAGFATLLDPCPNDASRDVDIMGEVAARTGFNILFATGLYLDLYAGPHWKARLAIDPDGVKSLTDLYVTELTDGVGSTGLKAAVIKVATGKAPFTEFEQKVMEAAAAASNATGAPIITHTEAVDGELQLKALTDRGVPAHRVIVGHCCGNPDHHYHEAIAKAGAYVGFDRFGLEYIIPDETRAQSVAAMLRAGRRDQVILSHDCVFHMFGQMSSDPQLESMFTAFGPLHISRVIAPRLQELGVAPAEMDHLLYENPRRYFEGAAEHRPRTNGIGEALAV